jgi:hypothetical protein
VIVRSADALWLLAEVDPREMQRRYRRARKLPIAWNEEKERRRRVLLEQKARWVARDASVILTAFARDRYWEKLSSDRPVELADLRVSALSGELEGDDLAKARTSVRAAKRRAAEAKRRGIRWEGDEALLRRYEPCRGPDRAHAAGRPPRDSWPLNATEAVRWRVSGLVSGLLKRLPTSTRPGDLKSGGPTRGARWVVLAMGLCRLLADAAERNHLGSPRFSRMISSEIRSLATADAWSNWIRRSSAGDPQMYF